MAASANGTAGAYGVTASATFALTNVPLVSTVGPSSGDMRGGSLVTIGGAGFAPGTTSVTIGGATAAVEDVTATGITVRTPAHAAGAVDVVVTVNGIATTKAGAYTYGAAGAAPISPRTAASPAPPMPLAVAPPMRAVPVSPAPPPGATPTPAPLPAPMRRAG